MQFYEMDFLNRFVSILLVHFFFLVLNEQHFLLVMPHIVLFCLSCAIIFLMISKLAKLGSEYILHKSKALYPTVILWLYPSLVFVVVALVSHFFLSLSWYYLGRSYWNNWLHLTAQDATLFLFSCFASMILHVALEFFVSLVYLIYSFAHSASRRIKTIESKTMLVDKVEEIEKNLEAILAEQKLIQLERIKAARFNRRGLYTVFALFLVGSLWVLFVRPELVLYYRAEIQLKTLLEPLAAYRTYEHLTEKYPNYYLNDFVKYRMAWILDRRVKSYGQAKEKYQDFLTEYGNNNVWSSEAMASLVRISMDKFGLPLETIKWADLYLKYYPKGVMAPHMYLYKIRAFSALAMPQEVTSTKTESIKRFQNQNIQLVNVEDRALGFISFEKALETVMPVIESN